MEEKKTKLTAGADEKTPSRPQYFSWINNTNEGSTEENTLINLDYFKWLYDEYGMKLDIYAWDAGNLDGSRETYETFSSPKLTAQYPRGYRPIADKAARTGIHMGVWCGPDGFGETEEDAKKRMEQMISLARDYNFGLFKIDGVCGQLRPEKRGYFVEMMKTIREYQPDFILLNHRLELGIGNPYATTFLWEGVETYIDVHVCNHTTALHNRAYMFLRNRVPGLERLAEDHGVCISSCLDYFEDDLIYQAFNRCLILAPEIYANPWFLRDDEQAKLAHIYNLHRRYADILVNGKELPDEYAYNCTSRGDAKTRFFTLGNCSWKTKTVSVRLGEEIGLEKCEKVAVKLHHPHTEFLGVFGYGDIVDIPVMPFRAALVEARDASLGGKELTGCAYDVIKENDREATEVKIIRSSNNIALTDISTGNTLAKYDISVYDNTNREPFFLGTAEKCELPENAEALYERTLFTADNDAQEARALKRSGETKIPQVKAARDAFFSQKRYKLRGCEGAFAFDGDKDTFFDGLSKTCFGGCRDEGGCLRVDFGKVIDADSIIIEYFEPYETVPEFQHQHITEQGNYSTDLSSWKNVSLADNSIIVANDTIEYVVNNVHNLKTLSGDRKQLAYVLNDSVRYFRLPEPIDRIFKIAAMKNGTEIPLENPTVNNLFAEYSLHPVAAAQKTVIKINKADVRHDSYIAVALNGEHGEEDAYAVAEYSGKTVGFPLRAPSYISNFWECPTRWVDEFYTYYLPVTDEMCGKEMTIYVLLKDANKTCFRTDVYLCDGNSEKQGQIIKL